MIEHLFGSKTRVKLLHLFLNNPNRSFYVREITRKIDEQINSVRRELSNLLKIGIIKSDTSGNKLYYEINQKNRHYDALKAMFSSISTKKEKLVSKTGGDLAERFTNTGSIELLVLAGRMLREQGQPVDILIIGNVNKHKLEKLVKELEQEEDKELRYTVLSPEDFEYRLDMNDRFVNTVLEGKITVAIGELPKQLAVKK